MRRGVEFGCEDASGYADDVLREANLAGDPAPNMLTVAENLRLPVRSIRRGVTDCPGELSFDRFSRPILRVWDDLDEPTLQFVVGILLGSWCASVRNLALVDERAWSHRFAGALLAPRGSLWGAWLDSKDIVDLCGRFPLVPSTTLMIRLHEAGIGRVFLFDHLDDQMRPMLVDEALVTRAIYVAAANAFRRGPIMRPGMRAARLPDARARVAVVLSIAA